MSGAESVDIADAEVNSSGTLPPITGVFDVCLGVRSKEEFDDAVLYYQQFGYGAPYKEGVLSPEKAETLYGHRSEVTCVRLPHQDSDHGLLRVMYWAEPRNEGTSVGGLRACGSRWTNSLTADIFNVTHHARIAQTLDGVSEATGDAKRGLKKVRSENMYLVEPVCFSFTKPEDAGKPFVGDIPHVHEMLIARKVTGKQALFCRSDYTVPSYGKMNPDAHFPTSQFAHVGLFSTVSKDVLEFYDKTMGLLRASDAPARFSLGSEAMLDITKDSVKAMDVISFDDPRSSTDVFKFRSGRLHYIRVDAGAEPVPDITDLSSPGSLGLSMYSYTVTDIHSYHEKLSDSTATRVTEVMPNEFGEASFCFVAPDGYYWQLIQRGN